jgi:GxxExxY protein
MEGLKHAETTGAVIKAFYTVYNELGPGFLEKVYENALALEMRMAGLVVEQQKPISVYYRDVLVGEYFADLIANDRVIVELKTAEAIARAHEAQLVNYLKATKYEVGLLLNFGKTAEYKRRIHDIRPTELFSHLTQHQDHQ